MGRSSILVSIARSFQKLPLWLLQWLEWPFYRFSHFERENPKMLILLALPRSGSTLTYQIIAHGLSVQYLSNLWHLLYQLPLFGGWLSRRVAARHISNFSSTHGFVEGLDGPAEGLQFWQWWLDCGLSDESCYRFPNSVRNSRICYLRKVLAMLTHGNAPFASAYLGHSLMPDRIYEVFPSAVLIRLRRNPVDNALSLLKCMREGNTTWFSVVPRECRVWSDGTEHERVAAQVYWLNRRLDDACCVNDYLDVWYEALCENPSRELSRICDVCQQKGWLVKEKFDLPDSFSFKPANLATDVDAQAVAKALSYLEEEHGLLKQI